MPTPAVSRALGFMPITPHRHYCRSFVRQDTTNPAPFLELSLAFASPIVSLRAFPICFSPSQSLCSFNHFPSYPQPSKDSRSWFLLARSYLSHCCTELRSLNHCLGFITQTLIPCSSFLCSCISSNFSFLNLRDIAECQ